MSWFKDLLRNPPPKTAPTAVGRPGSSGSASPTPLDPEAARASLAAATEEEQRRRCAEDLGRVLAGTQSAPRSDDLPAVWAAAVCHAADKPLALRWLANVHEELWLGEVAAHARFAEVRLSAVQRISDHEVLESVARQSRGKDKSVFRHCYEMLRQRRHGAERARRAAQLADSLRALLAHYPLSITSLLDLQRDLQSLEDGAESLSECRDLLDQCNERLKQESEARRTLQARRDEAAELVAQCAESSWPPPQQLERWRDGFSSLTRAQAEVPEWLTDKAASHDLAASLRQIQSRLAALAADEARAEACEQFLSGLDAGSLEPEAAAAWQALPKPDKPEMREHLRARWQAVQAQVRPPEITPPPPRPEPRAQPQIDIEAVSTLLDKMERALEEGHLAEADAAGKKIKSVVGGLTLRRAVASRLQRAHTRLGELSGWAKWSAEQQRQHLIATAEELLAANHDVEHLAVAVPALRDEWKRLNGQATAPQGEWERFDSALTKAYQPVAAHRAEEAARRAQARADKEALCSEWDAFAAAINWEQPDYPAIESARHRLMSRWRSAPLAGFRDERVLRKRFDALIAGIDQQLAAARSGEIERREKLIADAEALREAADLRAAMAEAKVLQERWRSEASSLRLARADEHKLWRRFRGACDAVFERRTAQRAEAAAQREQRAQARVALLDTLASALEAIDANQIKRALAQFRADWDGAKAGTDAPPTEALEARARAMQHQAQQRIEALHRDAYRVRLEALAQQAAPSDGADPGTLAEGRKARESLLIDLEIALDLPTPDEFAAARRQRQLERLQNRFRGGRQPRPQAEELLAQWHATAASADAAMDRRVAAVVRKLLEQRLTAERK